MDEEPEEAFTVWHGLLLAETAALLMGLLIPLTPSKTGSERGLPDLLLSNPSYAQEVVFHFVLVNVMIALIGGAAWVWVKRSG